MVPSEHATNAVTAAARIVLAAEREALGEGAQPTALDVLADRVVATVRPRGSAAGSGHQRDGRDHPHEPRAGAVAACGDRGGRARPRRRRSCSSSTARPAAAAADIRAAEDAARRADRRRGRARHEQQRRGRGARRRAGGPAAASPSRAASSSRSAAASGSRRSSGARARGSSRSGTTNRTRAADFEAPLADGRARVVLRVHPSNFAHDRASPRRRMPSPWPRVAHAPRRDRRRRPRHRRAARHRARSGWPTSRCRAERLAAGADLVTFSGDKLVGGPQAGLIVGRADLIAAAPTRPAGPRDAARQGDPRRARRDARPLPGRTWRRRRSRSGGMIAAPAAERSRRGPTPGRGGASAADASAVVAARGDGRRRLAARPDPAVVRRSRSRAAASRRSSPRSATGEPAVVGRIADDAVVLDLRTVDPRRRRGVSGRDPRGDRAATGRSRSRPSSSAPPGHIDHGKTTLLRALTGIDADRLPEERRAA